MCFKKWIGTTAPNWVQMTLPWANFWTTQYVNININDWTIWTTVWWTINLINLWNGWYRWEWTAPCTTSWVSTVSWIIMNNNSWTAVRVPAYAWLTTSDVLVWGVELRVANDILNLPYQRVNTATDYNSVGFPVYISTDWIDDWMSTTAIDFTTTDKLTVCTWIRKISDGTAGILVELSTTAINGAFFLAAPWWNPLTERYFFRSNWTISSDAKTSNHLAPTSSVISCIWNISGDSAILRVNWIQNAISTSDQWTWNYGNHQLFLFRRWWTTLPFTGRMYGLVIVWKLLKTKELAGVEKYMNLKTKAY
jgi:hypothetical protein